jgi:hypothetical protein
MADNGNQTNTQTQDSEEHEKSLKRSWKSSGPVAKLTVVFAGIAALSTSIYAIVACGQLWVMHGQLDEMTTTRRPWVGLSGELKMTRPPNFQVSGTPGPSPILEKLKERYPNVDKPIVQVEVWVTWAIQNYGASPARHVQHTFFAYATDDPRNPPTETKNMACVIGNQMESYPEVLTTALFPSNTITIPETNGVSGMIPGTKNIAAVWLVGCITYEDTATNRHHTRILWVSDSSSAGKPELAIENPPLTWTPFTKFRLVESDVD